MVVMIVVTWEFGYVEQKNCWTMSKMFNLNDSSKERWDLKLILHLNETLIFWQKGLAIFMRFGSILQNPHVEKVGIVMNSKIELEGLSSNLPYIAIHVILIPTKKMQHAFQRFIAGWWWGSKVFVVSTPLHSAFVCVTEGPLIHLEPQMFAPTPWVHTKQATWRSCPFCTKGFRYPKRRVAWTL